MSILPMDSLVKIIEGFEILLSKNMFMSMNLINQHKHLPKGFYVVWRNILLRILRLNVFLFIWSSVIKSINYQ